MKVSPARRKPGFHPRVEALEDRTAPAALNPTTWTAIGPAAINNSQIPGNLASSGRIAALAADPTDVTGNTIFIAAAGGGVWKTTNGGANWTPLTDNQATLSMGAIALAPSNHNIIYAGTGEANSSSTDLVPSTAQSTYYGRGILKSTDGGANWTLLGNSVFNRRAIAKIVIDPANPSIVLAAVGKGHNGLTGNEGVWRSTDGGANWTNETSASGIADTTAFTDLVIDPANSSVFYAAAGDETDTETSGGVTTGTGNAANGVYKSTNGGVTWTLFSPSAINGVNDGRITLAIAPSNHDRLYVSVSDVNGNLLHMVRFDNASTSNVETDLTGGTPDYLSGQGNYDTSLIVDPANPDRVYAGGSSGAGGFVESTNKGVSWTNIGVGQAGDNGPHADHHGVGFDATGKLLEGNDGGLWKLDNPTVGAIHWTDLNGNLNITQFYGIGLDTTNPNLVYGGTQDNGTETYTGSTAWNHVLDGDGGKIMIDPANAGTVYGIINTRIQKSTNFGVNWNQMTPTSNGQPRIFPDTTFTIDTNVARTNRLWYGDHELFMTINGAAAWTQITTVGANGWNAGSDPVDAIGIGAASAATLYASTRGGHFFVTTNLPATPGVNANPTWVERDPVPASAGIDYSSIAVDPTDSNIVYVTGSRFGDLTSGQHVWRTINGGATWSNITGNLPDVPVWSVILNKRSGVDCDGNTNQDILYLGTDHGVYASDNLGASWFQYAAGLPNVQVHDLQLNTGLNILAAGTFGRGAWELNVGITAAIQGNTLVINGDQNDNVIAIRLKAGDATKLEVLSDNNVIGTFAVASFTAVQVNGLGGNDCLTVDSVNGNPAPANGIAWDGGAGSNDLRVLGQANTFHITGANAGDVNGTGSITFVNNQELIGGAFRDVFIFGANGSVAGTIYGGGALPDGDFLDYSPKQVPVTINLTTGAASFTGGVTGIQNVIGSGAGGSTLIGNALGNVLVGHGGGNKITAGSGRSVLIGGFGVNTVIGGASGDLIINGRTSYDANYATLNAILGIWQNNGQTYDQRLAALQAAGPDQLKVGVTVFLFPGQTTTTRRRGLGLGRGGAGGTVTVNSTLTGGGGILNERNWFFTISASTITDRKPGEVVTSS